MEVIIVKNQRNQMFLENSYSSKFLQKGPRTAPELDHFDNLYGQACPDMLRTLKSLEEPIVCIISLVVLKIAQQKVKAFIKVEQPRASHVLII